MSVFLVTLNIFVKGSCKVLVGSLKMVLEFQKVSFELHVVVCGIFVSYGLK